MIEDFATGGVEAALARIHPETTSRLRLVHQRGRIRGSGVEIEQAVAFIAEIRDGLVARVDVFFSWEAGLEAAGLRE